MLQVENGQYVIIPVEFMSIVIEIKEGKPFLVNNVGETDTEESLNTVRTAITREIKNHSSTLQKTLKQWKKFEVSKEFMEERELEFWNDAWKGFDLAKYEVQKKALVAGLEKALYELTDLMLEHNILIRKDDDEVEVKSIGLDDIKNMFDGFGKSE